MTVCKQRPQSPSVRQERDQKRSAAANGFKEIEHALNDGAQVEPLSQSKIRHSECVQGTRIEKGKGAHAHRYEAHSAMLGKRAL